MPILKQRDSVTRSPCEARSQFGQIAEPGGRASHMSGILLLQMLSLRVGNARRGHHRRLPEVQRGRLERQQGRGLAALLPPPLCIKEQISSPHV